MCDAYKMSYTRNTLYIPTYMQHIWIHHLYFVHMLIQSHANITYNNL